MDLTISRLRPKVEADPARPEHLLSTVGVGYRLVPGALGPLPEVPTNVVADPLPLVGREGLCAEVAAAVARGGLVTLHGPGGIGKSRLARELALAGLAGRPGGVWWVEVGDGGADLGGRVAAVLGLDVERSEGLTEAVGRALAARRRTLLVLDGADVDASGARTLQGWLRSAPELTVLVTGYTPVGLVGEAAFAVPPLDEAAAAALFAARSRGRGYALAPRLARAVAGIPLAITIAAAWAHVVDGDALAAALESGGGSLPSVDPERPERHRSLAACIEATARRLSAPARALLHALSVHAGDITLADADAHAGQVSLPLVGELLDAGLLQRTGDTFRLLPPVRSVAAARLREEGGHAAARATLLRRTLAVLSEAAGALLTADVDRALGRIAGRLDDVTSVWAEASVAERIRLLEGVGPVLRARGPLYQLVSLQESLLLGAGVPAGAAPDRASSVVPTVERGDLVRILTAGVVGNRMTRAPAFRVFEVAWAEAPDRLLADAALCPWALRKAVTDASGALALLDEAIPGAVGASALELELVRVALVANVFGEDPTDRRAQDALRAVRGSPWHTARASLSAARLVPSTAAAQRLLDEAEAVFARIGDATGLAVVGLTRAEFVHLPRGDLDRAVAEIDRAEERALRVSPDTFQLRVATPRAAVAAAAGRLDEVVRTMEGFREFLRPRVALAFAAAELRHHDEAEEHFRRLEPALPKRGPHGPPLGAWVRAVLDAEAGESGSARVSLADVLARAVPRGATRLWPSAALLDAVLAPEDPEVARRLDQVDGLGVDDVGVRSALPLVRAWVAAGGRLPAERWTRLLAPVAVDRSVSARRLVRLMRRRG